MVGLTLADKRTTLPRPEIYTQNLSTQYLVVWGSKKQQRRGWVYSNFTKGETFLVPKKVSAPSFPVPSKKDLLSYNLAKYRICIEYAKNLSYTQNTQ